MRFLIILMLLFLFAFAKKARIKRQSCISKMNLENCDASKTNSRYTYFVYHQVLAAPAECGFSKINWYFKSPDNKRTYDLAMFKGRNTAIFDKETYPTGTYTLSVKFADDDGNTGSDSCKILYICEPPVLIFSPSAVQYIKSGSRYSIDLSKSVNHGSEPLKPKIKMSCDFQQTMFCRTSMPCYLGQTPSMLFFTKHDPCQTAIYYNVSFKYFNEEVSAKSTIYLDDSLQYVTRIECTKNCDEYGNKFSNPKVSIGLTLKCVSPLLSCSKFGSVKPTWEVVVDGTRTLSSGEYKIENDNLIIKRDVMKSGQTAVVTANAPGYYKTQYQIETTPIFQEPSCDINPKSGVSLETQFKITCKHNSEYTKKYPPMFKVIQDKTDSEVVIRETPYDSFSVFIGATKGKSQEQLSVLCRDIFFNEVKLTLPPITLRKASLTSDTLLAQITKANMILNQGNAMRAMEMLSAITSEAFNGGLTDAEIDNASAFLLQSILMLPVESVYIYNQIATTLPLLYKRQGKSGTVKDMLSMLCKDMAKKSVKNLLKSKYAKLESESVKDNSRILRECIESILDDDKEEEKEETKPIDEDIIIIVTTPASVVNEPALTEDYPNYEDVNMAPQMHSKKLDAINTIVDTSEALAETLANGESYHKRSDKMETIVHNEDAGHLAEKNFDVEGATVRAGGKLSDLDEKTVGIAVTSFYNDSLGSEKGNVDTNIVDVSLFDLDAGTRETMEGVHVEIMFDVLNDTLSYENYEFGISDHTWNNMEIESSFNVHRVHVGRAKKCYVSIMNFDNDVEVVFTKNRRPNINDFKGDGMKHVIAKFDNATETHYAPYIDRENDYFIYAGILRKSTGKISTHYNVSFFLVTCVTFHQRSRVWLPGDCNTTLDYDGNSDNKIKCVCNHTSLFAATYKPVENKLDLLTWTNYKARFFSNYVIFLHVLGVFACYCIALCFAKLRKHHNYGKKLFFLTDNLKNDRYAYLLVVKTGGMNLAGTTSNVVVQVFGAKTNSKAHVLNYPDPEKRILQRNNVDWFVLTTDQHLGQIQNIKLWFDGIGIRPSWYCEHVKIIDLQDMHEWDFKIEQWLDFQIDNVNIECRPNSLQPVKEKIVVNAKKHIHYYYNGEHTWNIFTKNYDSFLSYEQRLTVILSQIYTTYAVGILLLRPPSMQISDIFGFGHFKFYHEIIDFAIVCSLIAFSINAVFIYFFKNSENQADLYSFVHFPKIYSYHVTQIIWAVLLIWITLCFTYLIIFGFWVTHHSSLIWIVVTVISFILTIFVLENVFLIIYNIVEVYIHKGRSKSLEYNVSILLKAIERQRQLFFKTFGELLMRPYFTKHYKNYSEFYVTKLKEYEKERYIVSHLFRNMCIFLFYIILLYIICLSKTDFLTRMSNEQMEFMIIQGKYSYVNFPLLSVDTIDDIYEYINSTIINTVHASSWYDGYNLIDGGLMNDFSNKILGVVQLRQQRYNHTCELPEVMMGLYTHCSNKVGIFKDWEYSDGSIINSAIGLRKTYNGEGYIAKLGRTLYNSYYILYQLKMENWIDVHTEVLFIEFWTYNANYNTFNAVRIMIERDQSGRIWKTFKIFTTRLFHSSVIIEYLITVELIVFSLINFSIMTTNIVVFCKLKLSFYKNFWNILDFFIITLSITIVVIHLVKSKITRNLLEQFEEADNNEFVHYFNVIDLENSNMYISGVVLCLATLRLWKFLRFGQIFQMMERTIAFSAHVVGCIAIYHIDLFLMFSIHSYLVLGSHFYQFHSLTASLTTFMLLSFCFVRPNYPAMAMQYSVSNVIFVAFLIGMLIFNSIYATILMISLGDSKSYFSNRAHKYTIRDYFLEELRYFKKMFKRNYIELRLRGGGGTANCDLLEAVVCPKEDNELYADCVFLSERKLNVMRLIAISVISNLKRFGNMNIRLTDEEYAVMARTYLGLRMYDREAENKTRQVFLVASDLDGGKKFVPFYRMQQIEYVVKVLLSPAKRHANLESSRFRIKVDRDHLRLENCAKTIKMINKALANIKIG